MSHLTLKEQLEALAVVSPAVVVSVSSEQKVEKHPKKIPRKIDIRKIDARKIDARKIAKPKPPWLEQAQYGVELLKAHFPACFKEASQIQPLKIGIKQDLVIALGNKNIVVSEKACMVNSLAYYVGSFPYLKSMIAGAIRIGLEGQPTGNVTAEEAQYSLDRRQAKLQKKQAPTAIAIV